MHVATIGNRRTCSPGSYIDILKGTILSASRLHARLPANPPLNLVLVYNLVFYLAAQPHTTPTCPPVPSSSNTHPLTHNYYICTSSAHPRLPPSHICSIEHHDPFPRAPYSFQPPPSGSQPSTNQILRPSSCRQVYNPGSINLLLFPPWTESTNDEHDNCAHITISLPSLAK